MDTTLADKIRAKVGDRDIAEVKMFGGLCFMLNGNMLVCAMRDGSLLARIGNAGMAEALTRPGASQMEMQGRLMKDYVVIEPDVLAGAALDRWIREALAFVGTMPRKEKPRKA